MAVIVDTSVIIAFFNKRDKNHKRAISLLKDAMMKYYGLLFISDYVIDETVTYLLKRTKRPEIVLRAGKFLLGELEGFPKAFEIIFTNKEIFNKAWITFKKLLQRSLSFTDCVLISLANEYNLSIMTFDESFKGLANIID
ncbi:MAG: type II toxin-antitoxin system VapC family toxin [Candidatus Odinarchaeota archaeon]|nr:type II toxin-antitoxin system VapC family toxin [Candidatus Odinarchaeota archaeon]